MNLVSSTNCCCSGLVQILLKFTIPVQILPSDYLSGTKSFEVMNQRNFIFRFVHNHNQPKPSCLHVDLSAVLKNTDLLYPFLQYLKKNDGVNLLQFCLSVEDFNKKMMVVDLKDDDLKSLHSSARDLYETYIKLGAVNFIKFDDDIIRDISSIINQGYKQVHKLRTSPPLFRAYEQVYNNLEDNLCPQFHNSDEV